MCVRWHIVYRDCDEERTKAAAYPTNDFWSETNTRLLVANAIKYLDDIQGQQMRLLVIVGRGQPGGQMVPAIRQWARLCSFKSASLSRCNRICFSLTFSMTLYNTLGG